MAIAKKFFNIPDIDDYYKKNDAKPLIFCHFARGLAEKVYNEVSDYQILYKTLMEVGVILELPRSVLQGQSCTRAVQSSTSNATQPNCAPLPGVTCACEDLTSPGMLCALDIVSGTHGLMTPSLRRPWMSTTRQMLSWTWSCSRMP